MQFNFANTNLKFFAFLFAVWLLNIPAIVLAAAICILVTSLTFPCIVIGSVAKHFMFLAEQVLAMRKFSKRRMTKK